MSGLSDEAILEGHDLIDGAEHEAKADPKDFKKVHPVGESGGSILPDKPSASSSSGDTQQSGAHGGAAQTLESKLQEIRAKLNLNK
ncbi:hypothetical protein F503_07110 [Ophiostoma piceae UAMH 11346]|uniref:Uncharacterized protein n=1 Tax=Ophiostoma piceae (strain UAMH 11346) TaxID=1262450 RepID=S3C724_OPHP1|nr:hypothetical protein F503_07110 [Ophiostoma piceae UAMH 11346]